MGAQVIAAAVGLWLMSAPAVLRYGGLAADHDHIAGPLIATLGLVAAFQVMRALRWCNFVLGVWLLCAPWVLGFPEIQARWNSVVASLAIAGLSLLRGRMKHRYGGGWAALWKAEKAQAGEAAK